MSATTVKVKCPRCHQEMDVSLPNVAVPKTVICENDGCNAKLIVYRDKCWAVGNLDTPGNEECDRGMSY